MKQIHATYLSALFITTIMVALITKSTEIFVILTLTLISAFLIYKLFKFIKREISLTELGSASIQATAAIYLLFMLPLTHFINDSYTAYKNITHEEEKIDKQ